MEPDQHQDPEVCFYSKLEEIFDNAELIITALRDLTYSSTDLTMGDTEEDVQEFLSQIEQFRGRINSQKGNEDRSKKELQQRLIEIEALRDLDHSKKDELKESEIKFADLEKSKKEEIAKLKSIFYNNEVNLGILRIENENLQEKLRSCKEEAKVYKNELDSVAKEKLERKFQKVRDAFREENETASIGRQPTPEQSQLASELPGEVEVEWGEEEMPSRPSVAEMLTFKAERRSLPLAEGNGDYFSDESEDGEGDTSKTTLACTDSEVGENDNQNEDQFGPVDNQISSDPSKPSNPEPSQKRSTGEPPRKIARMEQDPPPHENLISPTTEKKEGFECKPCGKTYRGAPGLAYHVKSVHLNIRFDCQVCGSQLATKQSLVGHITRCSLKNGMQICQQCKKSFRSLEELKDHQKSEHSVE